MKKIGVIVCEDSEAWGGEIGIGKFNAQRFIDNCDIENVTFELIYGVTGSLPTSDEIPSYTGFILTGSHYSANDKYPWIRRLETFVRNLHQSASIPKPKLFGICFGHQLIAKALGGEISKNASGKFKFGGEIVHVADELTYKDFYKNVLGDRKTFKIMQSHGEEVNALPKDAVTLGESLTCSHEVLSYGSHLLSVQGHPELVETKMKEIIMPRLIRNCKLSEMELQGTMHSFSNVDTDIMSRFVISFLTQPQLVY